jgi:hypothetical protein
MCSTFTENAGYQNIVGLPVMAHNTIEADVISSFKGHVEAQRDDRSLRQDT